MMTHQPQQPQVIKQQHDLEEDLKSTKVHKQTKEAAYTTLEANG